MEDTQWEQLDTVTCKVDCVLILVVMEDTQWEEDDKEEKERKMS